MAPAGEAELRAALEGADALAVALEAEWDPESFTPADHAVLNGEWSWLNSVVSRAVAHGMGGMIADDLAYVAPWGFDPATISTPTLLLHGEADRIVPVAHSEWLASQIATSELWKRPGDGHLSVLNSASDALRWIAS
jgi:pimeloyl-ACP methyl ester carboxylesterase